MVYVPTLSNVYSVPVNGVVTLSGVVTSTLILAVTSVPDTNLAVMPAFKFCFTPISAFSLLLSVTPVITGAFVSFTVTFTFLEDTAFALFGFATEYAMVYVPTWSKV